MKFRIGIAAASMALVAAGCGGSDTAQDNLGATVLAAATNTAEAETSKASMAITVAGASAEQTEPLTVTMDGALNYESGQGAFTVNTPATAASPASSTEMMIDNTNAYLRLPAEAAAQFNGKTWLKIDTNATSEAAGVDLAALSTDSGNPAEGLEMLQGISDDVTEVGKEEIRGDSTTHYRGSLDFAKAAEKESDQAKKNALAELGKLYGNRPLPLDVWLDDKDRVRKMNFTVDMSTLSAPEATQGTTQTGTVDFSMEFYEFGTDVQVTIPPTDQVITQQELQQMATQPQSQPQTQPAA
jgi:hypothetical protein